MVKNKQGKRNDASLSWREQRGEGWIPFRHRENSLAGKPRDIKEEGSDPSLRFLKRKSTPTTLEAPFPAGTDLVSLTNYVFDTVIYPLRAHPLPDVFTAVEDALESKVFARPTCKIFPTVTKAATKFFPMEPITYRGMSGPLAFYAMVHPLLSPERASSSASFEHRLIAAHELAHHFLHLAPDLTDHQYSTEHFERLSQTYSDYLDEKVPSSFGPSGDTAEAEAELCAFILILKRGYTQLEHRDPSDLRDRYRELLPDSELDPFCDQISTLLQSIPRPLSLEDVALEYDSDRLSQRPLSLSSDRVNELHDTASTLATASRSHRRAWLCRMIEGRFLEQRPRNNVLIRCIPDSQSGAFCTIERMNLKSVFSDVNEKVNPHLIRYEIHYPPNWDATDDPASSIELLKWFGLIDIVERAHPPTSSTMKIRKDIQDYDQSSREQAFRFAIAVDALQSPTVRHDPYLLEHVQTMAAMSTFDLSSIVIPSLQADPFDKNGGLHYPIASEQLLPVERMQLTLRGYVESASPPYVTAIIRDSRQSGPRRVRMPYRIFEQKGILGTNMRFRYELTTENGKTVSEIFHEDIDRTKSPIPRDIASALDKLSSKNNDQSEEP